MLLPSLPLLYPRDRPEFLASRWSGQRCSGAANSSEVGPKPTVACTSRGTRVVEPTIHLLKALAYGAAYSFPPRVSEGL